MQNPSIRRSCRNTAIALAAVTVLVVGAVHAQSVGVMVQDLKSHIQEKAQILKQIDQYVMQGKEYAQQIQQYEQMLTNIQDLGSNFQFTANTRTKMQEGPLIHASCNGGSGGILGNLLDNVTSLVNQTLEKSQQSICAEIIRIQVGKFNSTVDMLDAIDSNAAALQKVKNDASNAKNMGEVNSAAAEAASYSSQMATRVTNWSATMKANDAMLTSYRDMQSTLARNAMNAKPGLLGQTVQAAALTAAFSYHPSL